MSDLETVANLRREAPALAPLHTESESPRREMRVRRKKSSVLEAKSLLAITVIVLFAVTFVVQAFRVPSESMEKTLLAGDFLLADKVHFAQGGKWWSKVLPYESIRRGDVIVFRYPVDPSTYFVKRVIGIPGDHIRLQDKTVYLNGKPIEESYVVHQLRDHDPYRDNFPRMETVPGSVEEHWQIDIWRHLSGRDLVVPEDSYFVMGDNRDRSLDSRYWGFVPRSSIAGRPLVIYLSLRGLYRDEEDDPDDKLIPSGQIGTHFLQLARWNRTFHVVR